MNPLLPPAIFLTFLGTASFLIEYKDTRILIDPGDFFTNRFPVERARTLENIDLVLLTHTDFDHMNRLKYIPHSREIPVLAPWEAKKKLAGYNLLNRQEYILNSVRIKTFGSIHGVRHKTPHIGFLLFMEDKVLCHMGDAYRLDEALDIRPDYLFIALSGLETGVKSGLANLEILKPKTVIPMHWEVLFRSDAQPKELAKAIEKKFPLIRCLIPPYAETIVLE